MQVHKHLNLIECKELSPFSINSRENKESRKAEKGRSMNNEKESNNGWWSCWLHKVCNKRGNPHQKYEACGDFNSLKSYTERVK